MERRTFLGALAASSTAAVLGDEVPAAREPAKAKPMMLTLLGTGTPAPSLQRQGSGYLFEVANDLIVMDHGPGAHHRLLEAGHRAVEVSHAFFTHLHYDHRTSGKSGRAT